jgi:hypothetical protein
MRRNVSLSIVAGAIAFLVMPALAGAEGMTRIQQSDGTVQTYDHVTIEVHGHELRLHSPDRHDTLYVESDACTYVNEMQRCLPYATVLHRRGERDPIALERGTVYLNLSDVGRPPLHSAELVPPHSVLVLLRTARGTFVTVSGTVDMVK